MEEGEKVININIDFGVNV